jgi:hypothetical protein
MDKAKSVALVTQKKPTTGRPTRSIQLINLFAIVLLVLINTTILGRKTLPVVIVFGQYLRENVQNAAFAVMA